MVNRLSLVSCSSHFELFGALLTLSPRSPTDDAASAGTGGSLFCSRTQLTRSQGLRIKCKIFGLANDHLSHHPKHRLTNNSTEHVQTFSKCIFISYILYNVEPTYFEVIVYKLTHLHSQLLSEGLIYLIIDE